ncbi:MAG: gluconate 2-dehydrogenase subunit 3 family protein [Ferruginibacter sp.]|nr:gluconate 2-dehydrogenase subunit 3 family protein [Cytophagales bacterium]
MEKINRRKLLQYLGVGSVGAGLVLTGCEPKGKAAAVVATDSTHHHNHQANTAGLSDRTKELIGKKFFDDHEARTVRVLGDLILPKDERSGNASDAGVPEFINFMMLDQPQRQTSIRGGLRWLDVQCMKRHSKSFVECSEADQKAMLDDIAYPSRAKPEMSQGVAFFNNFRDLVSTGFWTSKMGIEDLGYMGNVAVAEWKGAPQEILDKLGVSYDA